MQVVKASVGINCRYSPMQTPIKKCITSYFCSLISGLVFPLELDAKNITPQDPTVVF